MKKIIAALSICLVLFCSPALSHHPAADIVDSEIYIMIDEMVSDIHAEMIFDEEMETTTIATESVSAAEELIDDGLLATLSLLDDDVTVSITFSNEGVFDSSIYKNSNANKWKEWQEWGGRVNITVDTLLKEDTW